MFVFARSKFSKNLHIYIYSRQRHLSCPSVHDPIFVSIAPFHIRYDTHDWTLMIGCLSFYRAVELDTTLEVSLLCSVYNLQLYVLIVLTMSIWRTFLWSPWSILLHLVYSSSRTVGTVFCLSFLSSFLFPSCSAPCFSALISYPAARSAPVSCSRASA
jgi:hypothetical protein